MIKVTLIGSGNVAQHLAYALDKAPTIELVQIYSRKKESVLRLPEFDQITDDLTQLKEADLYIIAVSDNAVADLASKLPFKNRLVAHTSGSVSIDSLPEANRKAVFYPLQTLSKNKEIDFSTVPLCLETQFVDDYIVLDRVAKAISAKVFAINSQQRKSLHVAAVFVSNFVNHLYGLGAEICEQNQVPFDVLKPLITETAHKVMLLSPSQAQTGPAKRGDSQTIAAHLEFLTDQNKNAIYTILTQSIEQYVEKL